jgi:hypothetical protein
MAKSKSSRANVTTAPAWFTTNITGWTASTPIHCPIRTAHFGGGHQNIESVLREVDRFDCSIDIVELMRRYFTFGPTVKYGHDQRMLGLMLWPLIRNHCKTSPLS